MTFRRASRCLGLLASVCVLVGAAPAVARAPEDRVEAFRGVGTWADVFDWAPSYAPRPPVTRATMRAMATAGVQTLYLQAARTERAAALVDEPVLRGLVTAARAAGLRVVLWFSPSFSASARNAARVEAMSALAPDGIGLDIESRSAPSPASVLRVLRDARAALPDGVGLLGVVYPPGRAALPGRSTWEPFPWADAAALADAWAVMAYHRETRLHSRDAAGYVGAAVGAVRHELGADAAVHVISGVATTVDEAAAVRAAAARLAVVGVSIYDWRSSSPAAHRALLG